MIFQRSDNTLKIKTASTLVRLNDSVELGEFVAPGPGEYDVNGIGAIVLPVATRTVVLNIEGLQVLYLDHPYEIDKDDEDFSNIDVVAIRISSVEQLKLAEQLAKDLEPSGLCLFGSLPSADYTKELSLNSEPVESWKVQAGTLPDEGTDIVVLK